MKRRAVLAGLAAAAAAPALGAKPAPVASRIGKSTILVAQPELPTGNAVLLLPTIAAIDGFIHSLASDLAAQGYLAVAWDPYDGEPAPTETLAQVARSKLLKDEEVLRHLGALVTHMTGSLGAQRIAAIGWCLGGRYALLLGGADPRLAAVSAYNPTIYSRWPVVLNGAPTSKADFSGQTLDEFALASRIACPVQVCRPGSDLMQAADYAELQTALYARRAPTMIEYFPEADHGFAYKQDVPNNRKAAALAWPATLALFASAFSA